MNEVVQAMMNFVTHLNDQVRLSGERGFPPEHREMLFAQRDDLIFRIAEYRRVVLGVPGIG